MFFYESDEKHNIQVKCTGAFEVILMCVQYEFIGEKVCKETREMCVCERERMCVCHTVSKGSDYPG